MTSHSREKDLTRLGDELEAECPNGAAAAAILSAGVGCFSVAACGWLGDAFPIAGHLFNFCHRTGPLSGVTTTAIMIWLILWLILRRVWGWKALSMRKINIAAFLFLGVGLLLTFPPFADFLQGK